MSHHHRIEKKSSVQTSDAAPLDRAAGRAERREWRGKRRPVGGMNLELPVLKFFHLHFYRNPNLNLKLRGLFSAIMNLN